MSDCYLRIVVMLLGIKDSNFYKVKIWLRYTTVGRRLWPK